MEPNPPTLRDKRKRNCVKFNFTKQRSKSKIGSKANNPVWKLSDRRLLHQALTHCCPTDIDSISKYLPHISTSEIRSKIQQYRLMAAEEENDESENAMRRRMKSIDMWCLMVREVMVPFDTDLSYNIGRVCEIIAACEDTELPSHQDANIRHLYVYLADLLQGKPPSIRLNRLEEALVMHLKQSLRDTLAINSIHIPKEYMKWKFKVLESAPDVNDFNNDIVQKAYNSNWNGFSMEQSKKFSQCEVSSDILVKTNTGSVKPGPKFSLNPFCIPDSFKQMLTMGNIEG